MSDDQAEKPEPDDRLDGNWSPTLGRDALKALTKRLFEDARKREK